MFNVPYTPRSKPNAFQEDKQQAQLYTFQNGFNPYLANVQNMVSS
jgi:hypothetical protein